MAPQGLAESMLKLIETVEVTNNHALMIILLYFEIILKINTNKIREITDFSFSINVRC